MSTYTKRLRREIKALKVQLAEYDTLISNCPAAYVDRKCGFCRKLAWKGYICPHCDRDDSRVGRKP